MPLRARSCGSASAHPGKLWDEIMTPLLPSEVLSRAADLIEKPGAWMQFKFAQDREGNFLSSASDEASCWCVAGAMIRIAGTENAPARWEASDFLTSVTGSRPMAFNDAPERTQSEVVSALRAASELARREGK